MRTSHLRAWIALLAAGLGITLAALACQGNVENMTVRGVPKYVCPSATPRPTSTPLPPNPSTYAQAFGVTLDYAFIHPGRTAVNVQYMAQNVGVVTLTTSIAYPSGIISAGPQIILAQTGNFAGVQTRYSVSLPLGMSYATLTVSSSLGAQPFTIGAAPTPLFSAPAMG